MKKYLSPTKRITLLSILALGFFGVFGFFLSFASSAHALSAWEENTIKAQIDAVKAFSQGRVGIMVHFTGTGKSFTYHARERFPFCSTVKLIIAAAVLHKSQDPQSSNFLHEKLVIPTDIVTHSPVLTGLSGKKLSVWDLCAAMLQESDNTATNMLLKALGGPRTVQEFARVTGGQEFRFEDYEPIINAAKPTDKRNATTPRAMISLMQEIFFGDVLNDANKEQLKDWLAETRAGNNLIAAALPSGWDVFHKSGAGAHGNIGDIAVIIPNKKSAAYIPHVHGGSENDDSSSSSSSDPILLAIYMTGSHLDYEVRADLMQQLTKIVLRLK